MACLFSCLDHVQFGSSIVPCFIYPFMGLLFDILDGRIARYYGTSSLGQQLDSLADLVFILFTRLHLVYVRL